MRPHLPHRVFLLWKDLEVFRRQFQRRQGLQAQVSPALHKLDQRLEGVEAEAVVPVVRQVSHEDADLKGGEG